MSRNEATSARRVGGFTLIELLIVVAIIGVLAGLALVIGRQVSEGGRTSVTKDLLRIMSQSLDATLADRDGKLSWKYVDESAQKNEFAIFDGRVNPAPGNRGSPTETAEPTVALLLLATKGAASIESAVGGLDGKFVTRAAFATTNPSGPTDTKNIFTKMMTAPRDSSNAVLSGLVIKDPWGNPIRFAHPKFFGGTGDYFRDNGIVPRNSDQISVREGGNPSNITLRRSMRPFNPSTYASDIGDSDEGLIDGGRGYFYSVGPDFDPGSRADNVYIDPVKYPSETEKIK